MAKKYDGQCYEWNERSNLLWIGTASYLENWQEDFWFQIFFLFRYFIEDIAERMAECPHPKSFYERFSRGA